METVYIESILLENFMLDSIVCWSAKRLSGQPGKFGRIVLSAGAGAVYAVLSVYFPFCMKWPFRIGISVLMTLLLTGFESIKFLAKTFFMLWVVTFIMGGCIFALQYLIGLHGYPLPYYLFLIGCLCMIVIVEIAVRLRPLQVSRFCRVCISMMGHTMYLDGKMDTGNMLRDLSGRGVLIAGKDHVLAKMPPACRADFESYPFQKILKMRSFAFQTASGMGEGAAFWCENIEIFDRRRKYSASAWILLVSQDLDFVLLSPMMGVSSKGRCKDKQKEVKQIG